MLRFIAHKLVHLVPVLLLVTFATMLLLELIPGDPAHTILGPEATPEQIESIHEELGLDLPVHERYGRWISNLIQGDLGRSIVTQQPVATIIRERLPVTLQLAAMAQVLALAIAIPVGTFSAFRARGRFDKAAGLAGSWIIAAPGFLIGLLLSYLLSFRHHVFPVTGWSPLSEDVAENLRHAFLPTLTLALGEAAILTRLLRSDMIATLQEDFILAARAKGLPTRAILFRHALRPSSFSLLTLAGLSFGRLLGGTVLIEAIFALPGLGQVVLSAIAARDVVVVQGIAVFIAVAYVLINAAVDLGYAVLDPRVRVRSA